MGGVDGGGLGASVLAVVLCVQSCIYGTCESRSLAVSLVAARTRETVGLAERNQTPCRVRRVDYRVHSGRIRVESLHNAVEVGSAVTFTLND